MLGWLVSTLWDKIIHWKSKLLSIKVLDSLGDGRTKTHVDIIERTETNLLIDWSGNIVWRLF